MTCNEYFDSRSISTSSHGRCPVRGCIAVLQPAIAGKAVPLLCPVHEIRIHTKTFGYLNALRNIRFEGKYYSSNIRGNKFKAETHRLGYENSEDALTWNVFASLIRAGRLGDLASTFAHQHLKASPNLFLWGLPIRLDDLQRPKPFPVLLDARNKFESGIHKMQTEPDIMLYAPGERLILIEAKFTSHNTVSKSNAKDVPEEKPKSQAGIISRYSPDQLPLGSMSTGHLAGPFFSQLYRNLVFAIWMAQELRVEWRLVSLVSELHERSQPDPTPFIHSLLPAEHRKRFVRYSWERLFHEHVESHPDLNQLADYLRFKSANCERGLGI